MEYNDLIHALDKGQPVVLLLGHGPCLFDDSKDPALKAASKRISSSRGTPVTLANYYELINSASDQSDEFFEWLAERADSAPTPEALEVIGGIAWSAVFTSSPLALYARAFRNAWRDTQPVLDATQTLKDPRRKNLLHTVYLFGRLGNDLPIERVPRSPDELRKRRTKHVIPMLNRLAEVTTPVGLLLMEAYSPNDDWLNPEDLSGVLEDFGLGQVHWFGWQGPESIERSPGLQSLISRGIIQTHHMRLETALRLLEQQGFLKLGQPPHGTTNEWGISLRDRVIQVPPEVWLRTSAAIHILDDSYLEPLNVASSQELLHEFREFLGSSDDPNTLLCGVRRGFAADRDTDPQLYQEVRQAIDARPSRTLAIVLHGQTGTGKSVALAKLAIRLKMEKDVSVLFSSQTGKIPALADVDRFCQVMEESGAKATAIIVDANVALFRYEQLSETLASRGRNVVVIGSTYAIDKKFIKGARSKRKLIPMSPDLSDPELMSIRKVLDSFAPDVSATVERLCQRIPRQHLLVLLYRLLPVTRQRIRVGLGREFIFAETLLRTNREKENQEPAPNALQAALIASGAIDSKALLAAIMVEVAGDIFDYASHAMFSVLVPGRLNLSVPVEIVMRLVGYNEVEKSIRLLEQVDLLRWTQDEAGNVFIKARSSLEARLICERRLGGADAEANILRRVLQNIRLEESGRGPETKFVLDLCMAAGPNGPDGNRYSAYYDLLSDTLGEVMHDQGQSHSGLMLQQATLGREYVKANQASLDSDRSRQRLADNVRVLQSALRQSPADVANKYHTVNLRVELAATYGFLARQGTIGKLPIDEVLGFYASSREWAMRAAASSSPDNYFPYDVMLWNALDTLKDPRIDLASRMNLEADVVDALDAVDEDRLDSIDYARFLERKQEAGNALSRSALEQGAFQELEKLGSAAGVLFAARRMVNDELRDEPVSDAVRERARRAAEYLRSYRRLVDGDARALRYLLRVWWAATMGSLLFKGERRPLPGTPEMQERGLSILNALHAVEGIEMSLRTKYLRAAVLWSVGAFQDSLELWREVSEQSDFSYSRRIIKHHVISQVDMSPKPFHGQVRWVDPQGRKARVFVEEVRQEIDCFPREFGLVDIEKGASMPAFHIAFNFIGPVADVPQRIVREKRT